MQQSLDPDTDAVNGSGTLYAEYSPLLICRPDPEPVPAVAEDEDSDIEILPAQGKFLNYRPKKAGLCSDLELFFGSADLWIRNRIQIRFFNAMI
jgi:hypothetical protein